jgi:hypothetical protein
MNALHSNGSVGMSAILKACLSMLNGKDEARMEMAKFWEAIFGRIDVEYVASLCTMGTNLNNVWVEISKPSCWHRWKIETPSVDVELLQWIKLRGPLWCMG